MTKCRQQDGFFNTVANNSIPQLPPCTTNFSKINFFTCTEKKLKNKETLCNYCALIRHGKTSKKTHSWQINKTNMHGGLKLKSNRKSFFF